MIMKNKYGKITKEKFEYLINNYQYIRNKSDLFWSAKNQMLYSKSGDKGYYGLSYALHPLEQQPSGFTNH